MTGAQKNPARTQPTPRILPAVALVLASLFITSCTSAAPADGGEDSDPRTGGVEQLLAPAVAASIRHSRDEALEGGARPIPRKLRNLLAPHFESELLDEVRWAMMSDRWGIDTVIAHARPRYAAITLDNVIVFFDEPTSRDLRAWIHELQHVRQYRSQGVDGFAGEYVSRWRSVEADTREKTEEVLARMAISFKGAAVRREPQSSRTPRQLR